MAVVFFLTLAGLALSSTVQHALSTTRTLRSSSLAFNIAESGVERTILWLRWLPSPPANTSPWDPFGGPVPLGAGHYQVTLTPDPNNPGILLKRYAVECRATVQNRQETVEALLQLASFGRYAYFTDFEQSSIASGAIWHKAGEFIDGPVHSNNSSNTLFHVNWNGSTAPIFRGPLTAVGTSINYSPGVPASESNWQNVYSAGSQGFHLGVSRVELPDNTQVQREAAWGTNSGFPSSNGVYFPTFGSTLRGGIYIVGDASVTFSVHAGNQRLTIVQGGVTYTVTIDRPANRTTVTQGSSTTTYTGTGNGVIYCTGNITSTSGVLADSFMSGSTCESRNAFTMATDLMAGKTITVTGDLTYATLPDREQTWDSVVNLKAAALGLVAKDVIIGSSAPQYMDLHAIVLAGGRLTSSGSFYAANYSTRTPPGVLTVLGGVIQKKRGPVGTFNASTGAQKTGFARNYSYDQRMAINPPPFFPTTGLYERLSWSRVSGMNLAPATAGGS